MGSLNTDGTRKTTVNRIGRNNGGRTVFSQNRLELSSVKNPSAVESSLNLAAEQTASLSDSTINSVLALIRWRELQLFFVCKYNIFTTIVYLFLDTGALWEV